jgi:type I restriction enzyme M protein
VAICVLNRAKRPERAGKVLFVDAAQEGYFRPGKAQNYLDPEHIEKIVAAYEAFEDAPGFAHVADLAEIEANDFNLNISRYVAPVVEEEQVDIGEVLARLREAERERDEAAKRMDELLAELGYVR